MGMVEHHPGMVVLRTLGMLTHVKPLSAPRQNQSGRKWTSGQQVGNASSSNPLQADQQSELTLHGRSQRQGMTQEVQHRHGRPCLPLVGPRFPVGWVGHNTPTSLRHAPAGEEINAWRAKAAFGDVSGRHRVTVCGENAGHSTVATAGLPNRATETDVSQQCFGHPARRGVEVPPFPLVARDMNSAGLCCPCCHRPRTCDRLPLAAGERQAVLVRAYLGGASGSIHAAFTGSHCHGQCKMDAAPQYAG